MQIAKNKAITIAILLTLFISLSMVALPSANAHDPPWNIKTYAYIDVNPDPVGVGQEAFVTFGIDKVPMTVSAQYGDRWTTLTIDVTYPDGSVKTLSGFTADNTGFAYTTFTAAAPGNYTFVCKFGGQTLVGANPPPGGFSASARVWIGDYYEPSISSPVTHTVQEEQIGSIPFGPLPTDYWQRPINMMNSNWNTISGNWLGLMNYVNAGLGYNVTTNFHPYVKLANTAHVLWTTPMAFGGLIGGEYGNTANSNFYATAQYECKFLPTILSGVLYYTLTPVSSTNKFGTVAHDLDTGEILWTKTMNGTLRCGQIYNYISPNQYGGLAYLWSTSGNTWSMYDAMTGNWILDIVNGTTGVQLVSQQTPNDLMDGSMLAYYINSTGGTPRLVCWNSSRAILTGPSGTGDPVGWSWRPAQNGKIDWRYGIQWEKPIATSINGNPIVLSMSGGQSSGNIGITGNAIILGQGTTGNWQNWQIEASYDIWDGHQNFLVNRTNAPWTRVVTYTIGDGIYIQFNNEEQIIYGFSSETGQQLWAARFPTNTVWGYFSAYRPVSGYGLMYDSTFDGHCYAWNMTTGELVWDWWAGPADYNTVYGSWPVKTIELVADGKVYLNAGHTYNPPLFRGGRAYCLNATTGELIWDILSFCQSNSPVTAAADGKLFLPNAYDNLLYCYGMGRTATTVEAPAAAITYGSSLVIRGTVTDQSPGETCLGIPAAGTPAIADEYMGPWMEYLYAQQPKPTDAVGVPVTLTVVDANGNCREIGKTTSGNDGFFSFSWKPDIPGMYTVYATFAGSESYYPSSSVTSFIVEEAAVEPAPEYPQPVDPTMTIVYVGIAILAAIAVVAVVLVLMLRKRP